MSHPASSYSREQKLSTCLYNAAEITSDANEHGNNKKYPTGDCPELYRVWLPMVTLITPPRYETKDGNILLVFLGNKKVMPSSAQLNRATVYLLKATADSY